jgi:uncharacterized protein (DUF1800 family)
MNTTPSRYVRCLGLFAIASLSLVSAMSAAIDPSFTREAWAESYGVSPAQLSDSTWLGKDSDGDGQTNGSEIAAGTNPFQAHSVIAISSLQAIGDRVQIAFPTVAGKHYFLQENGNLTASGGWRTLATAQMIGDGGEKTVSLPRQRSVFYRVLVQDLDSNGDGLADYAEYVWGLNSTASLSANASDAPPPPPPDGSSIVTVTADDPAASEDGPKSGVITVRRTVGNDTITIPITFSGTATAGIDYIALSSSVTLPVDVHSATLLVTPLLDALPEGGEIVTVTPGASAAYTLAGPANASVHIADSTAAAGTGLTGRYYDTSSSTYTNSANFNAAQLKVTRVDPTVDFDWMIGSPYDQVNTDNFSAVWTGYLAPTVAGDYVFDLQADDGARLYVNNVLIVDAWTAGSATTTPLVSGLVTLAVPATPGERIPIRVEYYESTGSALVIPRWKVPGTTTFATIPVSSTLANNRVYRDNTSTTNYGWAATYYNNSTLTPPAAHTVNETATLSYNWGTPGAPDSTMGWNSFSVRWTGQVQPQYSELYTFVVNCDDSAKLWVNGKPMVLLRADTNAVVDWPTNVTTTDRYARVALVAGHRYDIQLDLYEGSGTARSRLSWYSASQPKQVIPQSRLYPASVTQAPPVITSSSTAAGLVSGAFKFAVSASNAATITITGLPSWLSYGGGFITGTPPVGAQGDYQLVITATNAAGSSKSILNLHIEDSGRSITREFWTGVPGTSVAAVPVNLPPTGAGTLPTLEAPMDFGEDYATRIRGFITAPLTGNYYFWISGRNSAELWISNDADPINKVKRAAVLNGTEPEAWSVEPGQKSPWIALEEGQKYYIEILHKAGTSAGDNLAVGWLKPGQTGTGPSEIVPRAVLSQYAEPPASSNPGTLYVATLLSQGGAATNGVGTSTLRLSPDETTATMSYSYSGLTGPITSQHIHTDAYLTHASTIVFDIDTPETPGDGLQPDGTYKWTLTPRGTLSVADIREIIKQGKSYINLHTALYPNGEIRGNYTAAGGSRTFSVPPAPPSWTDDHATNEGASRFLTQATFGASAADVAALKAMAGYQSWINDQFTKTASYQLSEVLARETANVNAPFDETLTYNAWWKNAIGGSDQLRQRMAFALSEIAVVSAAGPLDNNARGLSYFYDRLTEHAFGNFRDFLEVVTLAPAMGDYLDMFRNDKPDQSIGRIPNENYAREIMQLFSVGLFRMWPDGTLMLNSKDELIPTYTQTEIIGYAHAFTGWDYGYAGAYRTSFGAATDWMTQMREVPVRHFTGQKRILDNVILPGLPAIGGVALDPYAVHASTQYGDPDYQALPVQELDATHEQLFQHPNTGPFICRQLIQRLVTSNPSRDYVYRVVQAFNNNGSGVRGDFKAVIKAILLDYEARSSGTGSASAKPAFGKQREPVLRVAAAARAFRKDGFSGSYVQNGTRTITVTTTTPHKLAANNSVYLQFSSGTTLPTPAIYTVAAITGSQNTSTVFTVNATGWITGTYTQAAGSNTVTVNITSHWLDVGKKAWFDFTSGGADPVLDGLQTVATYVSANSFTITDPGTAPTVARSGNVMVPRFTGYYRVSNSGLAAPNDKRITFTTNASHHLTVGDMVTLNFSGGNPLPVDQELAVESILDRDQFTVLSTATGTNLTTQADNGIYMFPQLSQPMTRSGALDAQASTYNMGSTESDLAQTPLNSPTVFNFFLPDYKFAGTLASQGLTTPEFQLTSDTNVIRQTNFFYNGIFNPGNTNGISSFKTGSNALIMDLSAWMGNATDLGVGAGSDSAKPWTNNENLSVLIDKLNILLTGGQLSPEIRTTIYNFTSNTANIAYNNATPSDTNKRDRIRAVLHLILTSPDYTIQR